jgi:hypothetical protein
MPRFVVATVEGYAESGIGGTLRRGVSAHVLDSDLLYALCASYRSEDRLSNEGRYPVKRGGSLNRGIPGALQAAQDEADRLNLWAESA